MDKWLISLLISVCGLFIFSAIGVVGLNMEEGEIVARGDASEELQFKGEWNQFYDIYAEDENIQITFETSSSHDPEYTYLQRCGVDDDDLIGFQGSCSDKFESGYLVADFTVEGSGGVGDVTLSFEGEGEVIVVKTSVISSGVWISVFCLGCCFSPIGIIISGIKLSKSRTNTSNTILFVNDTSQQGTSLQQMEPVYRPVDESGAEYDSHEISELMAEGYEREQAIAIAKDK